MCATLLQLIHVTLLYIELYTMPTSILCDPAHILSNWVVGTAVQHIYMYIQVLT